MVAGAWLLFLYSLPTKHTAERVSLWRKLNKFGALQLKTSAYLLPNQPMHFERFQWLARQVRDDGGQATLIRVMEIEGLTNEELARMFNDARARDYGQLMEVLARFIGRNKKRRQDEFQGELDKFNRRFKEIREMDYFDCPNAHDAQLLLRRAEGLIRPRTSPSARLDPKKYLGKTWLTRPRPEIDRVGSAWLIRRFIDTQGQFVFAAKPSDHPGAISYDMFEVEFTHQGENCTFETLVQRFGIRDTAVRSIAEMVHDADLEDEKFQRPECLGLDRVFKGWARLGLSDHEILAKGFECFEALYAAVHAR